MNRREVTKCLMVGSVAAAAATADWATIAPIAAGALARPPSEPIPMAPLSAVILDDRYASARRFADALAGGGTACLAAQGEAVSAWHRQCRPRLPAHAWRLAGMTTYCDFMLLRACARGSGGRLIHVAQHDMVPRGAIVHQVSAGEPAEMLAKALRHDDWAYRLAQTLARAPMHAMHTEELTVRIAVPNPAQDRSGTLLSWVIARTAGTWCG